MKSFEYEWWNVESKEPAGTITLEVKAKNRDNAKKQLKKLAKGEIIWETMRLDRIGHQR